MKKKPLGRGLESLIPKNEKPEEPKGNVTELELAMVVPNEQQPRTRFDDEPLDELVHSIKEKGVIQPIIVTKTDEGYMIIAGERRWRASGLAGLKTIPAVVKDISTEVERLELALIENIQRQDLNAYDLATAYKNLMDKHGYRQEDVARVIGKSRSAVANTLRLINLPGKALEALREELISEGHARALLSVEDEKECIGILKKIIENGLSVRETERLAAKAGKETSESENKREEKEDVFLLGLRDEMEEFFKTKIVMRPKKNGGTIEIKYTSDEELDRIIKTIRGEE
ncbi:ParB/RepB/Spo0J family partition protein [Limisalsivibrio acetivorans]|uniref:ParB/RepB/Spo0J family partition protein n=1 Tax=Limisalsivibrio acetivorans TaxID=1304888 RepID=UPI0003B679F6|nr:ParB/RepB/Spo0J family partition protein [Limisalsivibrio acetivorans]